MQKDSYVSLDSFFNDFANIFALKPILGSEFETRIMNKIVGPADEEN